MNFVKVTLFFIYSGILFFERETREFRCERRMGEIKKCLALEVLHVSVKNIFTFKTMRT